MYIHTYIYIYMHLHIEAKNLTATSHINVKFTVHHRLRPYLAPERYVELLEEALFCMWEWTVKVHKPYGLRVI